MENKEELKKEIQELIKEQDYNYRGEREDRTNIKKEEIIKGLVKDIFENEYDSKEFIRACVYEHFERALKEEELKEC